MNTISIPYKERNLIFKYRDIMRKNGGMEKNIDLQTIQELSNENIYRINEGQLSGDRVVVDVGGHIGTFSLMVAAMGATKVYTIEPNPDNFDYLLDNIQFNNFESVITPFPFALWDSEGQVEMEDYSRDSRVGSLVPLESEISKAVTEATNHPTFNTPTVTLDSFLERNNISEVDILKMDIEWSEYQVIPSWSDETMQKIKYLCIEFHGTDETTFGETIAHLTRQFCVQTLGSYERGGFIYATRY